LFLTVEEVAAVLRKGRTATYAAIERGHSEPDSAGG
jgi:hypothetical protein